MTTRAPHIIILGAGLIGLSSADALIRGGARVTVLETQARPLHGASFANSGMIHPSQACRWVGAMNDPEVDAAVHELAIRSRGLLIGRMGDLGLKSMQSRPAGCFQIFETEDLADHAQSRLIARGIVTERRGPEPNTFHRPSLFFPEDRSGDALAYGQALARAIEDKGGVIRTGVSRPILGRDVNGVITVAVEGGLIGADHVVVACGSQTAEALKPVGLDVPIQSIRGWAVDFDKPESVKLPKQPVMDAATRSALTPFEDWFRLSGTWGEESEGLLLSRWSEIMPDVMSICTEVRQIWSGERPVSAEGRPFIGPTQIPNLWINAGHGHMGWTLCAGSGDLMAEMILDGRVDTRFAHQNSAR